MRSFENPDSSAANRLGGRSTGGRPHEDPLVDCPRRDCAHGRQRPRDHEQCLQEQPSRMVRSNVRYPTPREDWAQLIAAPRTAPKYVAAVGDDVACKFSLRPIIDGRTDVRHALSYPPHPVGSGGAAPRRDADRIVHSTSSCNARPVHRSPGGNVSPTAGTVVVSAQ